MEIIKLIRGVLLHLVITSFSHSSGPFSRSLKKMEPLSTQAHVLAIVCRLVLLMRYLLLQI